MLHFLKGQEEESIRILAIDPGSTKSAYVIMDSETYMPCEMDKTDNHDLLERVAWWQKKAEKGCPAFELAVIENIVGSYGASIGKTTFDTAIMIGRLIQALTAFVPVDKIPRQTIRAHICPKVKANDKTIRDALIARFALHDMERGKGTKDNRDFFYGFSNDIWSAYAVGVTLLDKAKGSEQK